jgi:hypothetical protein
MHKSFLVCRRGLYGWLALGLSVISVIAYLWHSPGEPPNGGTWLGYTLGIIAAMVILWLLWFGVRKRQYSSTLGTLSEWLSGHVYFGLSLLVVATLHCGFQFGFNVHTLAYALMVMVIVSGLFGVFMYMRYPTIITKNRNSITDDKMLTEIDDIDNESVRIAREISADMERQIRESIKRNPVDIGIWAALTGITRFGRDQRQTFAVGSETTYGSVTQTSETRISASVASAQTTFVVMPVGGNTTMLIVGESIRKEAGQRLADMVAKRKALVSRLRRDRRYHALMQVWLRVHVPLSIALLATLLVHITSVFFYR